MTGHDIGIMAENNDDEDNFAPIDWLADHDAEPSRQLSKQAHYALQTEVCKMPWRNWTTAVAASLKAAGCKTMAV